MTAKLRLNRPKPLHHTRGHPEESSARRISLRPLHSLNMATWELKQTKSNMRDLDSSKASKQMVEGFETGRLRTSFEPKGRVANVARKMVLKMALQIMLELSGGSNTRRADQAMTGLTTPKKHPSGIRVSRTCATVCKSLRH